MAEINASNIAQEFRKDDFKAKVENLPMYDLRYRDFFPLEFNIGLEFSTIEKAAGAKVMADIVALGSRAPRKGRDFAVKNMGTLAKIEIARTKDEYDMFQIASLRNALKLYPSNQGVEEQLINAIYDDVEFTINGINARLEFGAKQLSSTGKITIVTKNNNSIQNVELNYGVATQNASKSWSAADADPLKDIQDANDAARKRGFRYSFMTLDANTFNFLLRSNSAKQFVLGTPVSKDTVLPNITVEQLNTQLSVKGLPTIRVWDTFVTNEGKDGERESVSGWDEGAVLFTVDDKFGNTKYTVSDEFTIDTNITMAKTVKDNFILSKMWGEEDPQVLHTKATAFALPVLNNTKKNLILKTKLA